MTKDEKSLLLKIVTSLSDSEEKESEVLTPDYLKEPSEYIAKLEKRKSSLEHKSDFNVGDILIWKDGLKNKRLPEYGQPCIIIEKLTPKRVDDEGAAFSEILDCALGFITDDDEFLIFNYDSSRFKLHSL